MILTLVSAKVLDIQNKVYNLPGYRIREQHTNASMNKFFIRNKVYPLSSVNELLFEFVTEQGHSWYILRTQYTTVQSAVIPKHWLIHMLSA